MYGDLTQFGLVDAVSGRGHVPMVEQNPSALVARDPNVNLESEIGIEPAISFFSKEMRMRVATPKNSFPFRRYLNIVRAKDREIFRGSKRHTIGPELVIFAVVILTSGTNAN